MIRKTAPEKLKVTPGRFEVRGDWLVVTWVGCVFMGPGCFSVVVVVVVVVVAVVVVVGGGVDVVVMKMWLWCTCISCVFLFVKVLLELFRFTNVIVKDDPFWLTCCSNGWFNPVLTVL